MRSIGALALVAVAVVLLYQGLGSSTSRAPAPGVPVEEVRGPERRALALAYYRYSYSGDLEKAYGLLAPSERRRLSFEDFTECPRLRRMGSDDTELIRATDGGLAVLIGPKPFRSSSGQGIHLPSPRVAVRVTFESGAWYVALPDCPGATVTTAR